MKKIRNSILRVVALASLLALAACSSPSGSSSGRSSETYTFSDTVKKVGTQKIIINGTETEYDIVEFGDWPQTIKADSVTVDETQSITRGAHTYYVGSDGNYYAKVSENAYENDFKYSDGTTVAQKTSNSEKYFKVEPIKWRVLTKDYNNTGKALLLAENILTANVPFYETCDNDRTIGDKTVYENNYMHSQVRAYLNGLEYQGTTDIVSTHKDKGFLQSAFSSSAQIKIATTTVDNSADSTTDTENKITKATKQACENTNDKIFLVSEKEVTTAEYGFDVYNSSGSGNSRNRVTTDYAKANFAYQCTTEGYGGYWWLRSPDCTDNNCAYFVGYNGYANLDDNVKNKELGLVPALCVEY